MAIVHLAQLARVLAADAAAERPRRLDPLSGRPKFRDRQRAPVSGRTSAVHDDEEANSRVYGGIHFTFDTTAGFGVCVPLADYVFVCGLWLKASPQ
jgi:hypothetical protein